MRLPALNQKNKWLAFAVGYVGFCVLYIGTGRVHLGSPTQLAEIAARGDALGTLARVFVKMAHGVQGRERQLRADVQKLATTSGDRNEVAPKPGDTLILPLPPR